MLGKLAAILGELRRWDEARACLEELAAQVKDVGVFLFSILFRNSSQPIQAWHSHLGEQYFLSLFHLLSLFLCSSLSPSLFPLILAITYISTLTPHSTFLSHLSLSSILVTQIHVLTYGQISRSYVLHIRLLARTLPGFFPVLYVHSSDDEYRETH